MAVLGALGDLVLALSADTAKFESDLGRAQRMADKFGKEVGKVVGNLAGALLGLGAGGAFGALVKGQIDAADAAGKMAQKLGLTTEAWSEYVVAARLSDVTNEQLQKGFQQLSKNQLEFLQAAEHIPEDPYKRSSTSGSRKRRSPVNAPSPKLMRNMGLAVLALLVLGVVWLGIRWIAERPAGTDTEVVEKTDTPQTGFQRGQKFQGSALYQTTSVLRQLRKHPKQ
jgi:hypothetical protein